MNTDSVNLSERGVVRYPPGASLGPRDQGSFEFVWIVSGNCRFQIDRKEFINAPADSIFLLRPRQTVFFEWDQKEPTVHGYIHFDLTSPIRELGVTKNWPIVRYLDTREDLLRPLLRYGAGTGHLFDPAAETLAKVNLLHSLFIFVHGWAHYGSIGLPGDNETINKLYQTIHMLLDRQDGQAITLKSLADRVHLSPEHLCRLCRKVLRITPIELVYRIRIERACRLLTRTDISLKKIAELTGFFSVYHFSRRFKKQTGVPPAHYRRLACTGQTTPYSNIIPPLARDFD